MRKKRHDKINIGRKTENLEEFKAFLGPLAEEYTVSELRRLRNEMNAMAGVLLDFYLLQNAQDLPTISF